MGEKNTLTCPNKACGKIIAKPVKTTNNRAGSKVSYNACPYCLTEIGEVERKKQDEPATIPSKKEKPTQNQEKSSGCNYHLGYLNEKGIKGQIPDECMMCADLIECTLKKPTSDPE